MNVNLAKSLFAQVFDWIKQLPLEEGGKYTATFHPVTKSFSCARDNDSDTTTQSNPSALETQQQLENLKVDE